ncbi:MAG: invasion associated locus B family protein [Pseudomonadota bacterium]
MKNTYSTLFFATISLIASFSISLNAQAEVKVGDRFGDWVFECTAISEGKTSCAISQTIVSQKNNRRIAKLNIARNPQTNTINLTALLPLGMDLASGVSATLDQGKSFQLSLKTCIQQGCIASYALDANMLKTLQSGQKLNITFSMSGAKEPLNISSSTSGLSDGLKAANLI